MVYIVNIRVYYPKLSKSIIDYSPYRIIIPDSKSYSMFLESIKYSDIRIDIIKVIELENSTKETPYILSHYVNYYDDDDGIKYSENPKKYFKTYDEAEKEARNIIKKNYIKSINTPSFLTNTYVWESEESNRIICNRVTIDYDGNN